MDSLKKSGLKLYIWRLKTFDRNIYENMFWRSCYLSSCAMILFICMAQISRKIFSWTAWTRIGVNSHMYEHNGFHQNFHNKTTVEKIISVVYHSEVEFNHRTLYLPFSSGGKGSLTSNTESRVEHALWCSYTIVCESCLKKSLQTSCDSCYLENISFC